MAWIESHQTLKEHPKLYQIMEILNISRPQAVGHLHILWWWCVDYASDGRLKQNDLQIARAAEWSGDPELFVKALIEAKFLDRTNGVLTVHDWLDFCGSLVEKRLERLKTKKINTEAIRENIGAERMPTQPNPTNRTQPNQPYPTQPNQDLKTISQISEQNTEILLKQFNPVAQERIKVYLERVRLKNKSKTLSQGRMQTLLRELISTKERWQDEGVFLNAVDMAINYDACNIGYVNAVMKNKKVRR